MPDKDLTAAWVRIEQQVADHGSMEDFDTVASLQTWRTELLVAVRHEPDPDLQRWLRRILAEEVADIDARASRFRADSELSAVNRAAGTWVQTSWEFVSILTASINAASATDGLVDPLLGRHVVAAGYDRWAGQESGINGDPTSARWEQIEISPGRTAAKVRIPQGSALDVGAVAKGWLADRLAVIVHASTGLDVCANMGGDLRVISPSRPWIVGADPEVPGVAECAMELSDAGLATSGVGHRRWRDGHHIIDPRTGRPADTPWFSVSALAADAASANAAATAGMILGEDGPAWIGSHGLDAWFVGSDADTQAVAGDWPSVREPAVCGA